MSTPALQLTGIGKTFGDVRALHGVDLSVQPGTVHCILGENGAGKSTLCNVVYGGLRPDTGTMTLSGRRYAPASPAAAMADGVAMVHQHFSLIGTMTVAENLLLTGRGLRLRRAELRTRLDRLADDYHLRIDSDALVSAMPIGARQKVEIVKALLTDPSLILLDEPTGVLDPGEIDALIETCQAVAAAGKAVVLVTHKLGEVARVADAATVLRGGEVAGGGRMSELTIPQLTTAMVGRPVSELSPVLAAGVGAESDVGATPERWATGPVVLGIRGVRATRADGSVALSGVGLEVRAGEIVGIAGVEGNGQSELVAVLSGATRPESGTVTLGDADITSASPAQRTRLGLGVVPEDRHREAMVAELSLSENLFLGRLHRFRRMGLLDRSRMDAAAGDLIEQFSVRTPGPGTSMGALSGGNQQKVVLARELSTENLQCLVAAQPTRGLDIGAVEFVLNQLRSCASAGNGVLVVSSEIPELLALCDRIFVSYRGALLGPVDTSAATAGQRIGELMTGTAA